MVERSESVLISYADVAAMLSTSVRTVRRAVERGHLPAPVKLGGVVRFYRADVEACLERLRREGTVSVDQILVERPS